MAGGKKSFYSLIAFRPVYKEHFVGINRGTKIQILECAGKILEILHVFPDLWFKMIIINEK